MRLELFFLAHSRAGDKGDSQTLSLIPYDAGDYELLAREVTAERVKEHFAPWVRGAVTRYDLPNLAAFNFVLEAALQGGVNSSLALDTHGKSRSSRLLEMELDVPGTHAGFERRAQWAAEAERLVNGWRRENE